MVQRAGWFLCCALLLATCSARAEDAKYPKEVQEVLADAEKQCRDAGGSGVKFEPEIAKKLDLTGSRNDYIVDLNKAECDGAASLFCGTGGCNLTILAAKKDGTLIAVYDDRARGYEILPGKAPRTIRFQLHGMYCGRSGNPSCYKNHRITLKPFEFKEPR